MSDLKIRDANVQDLPRILEIYAYYIRNTTITFEEVTPSLGEMEKRFLNVKQNTFPYCVLCLEDKIIGYGYIGYYHRRSAYRFTGEHSLYLDPDYSGLGYGSFILKHLIDEARKVGLKNLVAVIAGNEPHASHKIHQKFGFKHIGQLNKCGFKFGHWVDVSYMQKELA